MNPTHVSYSKRSKRERRKADLARRQSWGAVNPITRRPPRSCAYSRAAMKRELRRLGVI